MSTVFIVFYVPGTPVLYDNVNARYVDSLYFVSRTRCVNSPRGLRTLNVSDLCCILRTTYVKSLYRVLRSRNVCNFYRILLTWFVNHCLMCSICLVRLQTCRVLRASHAHGKSVIKVRQQSL